MLSVLASRTLKPYGARPQPSQATNRMTPYKLTAELSERSHALSVASALENLLEVPPDALTVFEDIRGDSGEPALWRIDAYFTEPRDPAELAKELEAVLDAGVPVFAPADVPDLNWVALSQAALPPVRAQRFTIHGSHDRHRVPQGPNSILIEAGEAFGTAHHATTYGCLLALDRIGRRQTFQRILDLGCGSGILAIAARRLWPRAHISGVDIDPQSIVVAKDNARINSAGRRLHLVAGAGVSEPSIRARAPYDLVIANILAGPLIRLAPDIRRVLYRGGTLILSGILNREAAGVIAAYAAQGFALVSHRHHDGWSAIVLTKREMR